LDILKDRLYTTAAQSKARRSAQSALYHITHSLVRLFAPILSFTAEEAWEQLTTVPDDSVLLHTWHHLPSHQSTEEISKLISRWSQLRQLRSHVQKKLEETR